MNEHSLQIQDLFTASTPDQLEKGVEEGLKVLNKLKSLMRTQDEACDDVKQWLQLIDKLEKQVVPAKTVLGVVGNTGAGKSSVINALLDLDRLVPTSCMRACTAVVIEISYNYEEDGFRAEVEFIKTEDWKKELSILQKDVSDGNENDSHELPNITNKTSEVGIAYAKIRAVYPELKKEDIQHADISALMDHNNVKDILGSKKTFSGSDAASFYKKLQFYVDSREKSNGNTGRGKAKDTSTEKEISLWPLIRVVRLYVRADILSTGAVIVDLPGTQDSNQARAAIAESYMQKCRGIWVVAPINRAVDDKIAKSLLGETFKRQLKMDGSFDAVTFICSKTDELSFAEAEEYFGLEDAIRALRIQLEANIAKRSRLQNDLGHLKVTRDEHVTAIEDLDEEIDLWDHQKESLEDKLLGCPPSKKISMNKRKRGTAILPKQTKRRKAGSDDDSDHSEINHGNESGEEEVERSELGVEEDALTEEEIAAKLAELKGTKKERRQAKARLITQIQDIHHDIIETSAVEAKIRTEMSAMCILARNQHSKAAIRHDFASGIQELDHGLADGENVTNSDPNDNSPDYDEIERKLPVFCVSSRAYQKLQGRLLKDPATPGFRSVEDTELPQLRTHCKELTIAAREAACRPFINGLSELLSSLQLWAFNNGTLEKGHDQQATESRSLEDRLRKLDRDLEEHIKGTTFNVGKEIEENVNNRLDIAISNAESEAQPTRVSRGAPVPQGGYLWQTYKAICRRSGVFTNANGTHDWNKELSRPMLKHLTTGWAKTFFAGIPSVFDSFATGAGVLLETFHRGLQDCVAQDGIDSTAVQKLRNQLTTRKARFHDISNTTNSEVKEKQREINRAFTRGIVEAMQGAYDCSEQKGDGLFERMKERMTISILNEEQDMFKHSAGVVAMKLEELIKSAEGQIRMKTDEIFTALKRDYRSALGGEQGESVQKLSKAQWLLRRDILEAVKHSEDVFKRAAGLEPAIADEDGVELVNHEAAIGGAGPEN